MNRFILYSAFFLFACNPVNEEPQEAATEPVENIVSFTPEQVRVSGIVTGKPKRQMMQMSLPVTGVAEAPPEKKVTVSFPFGGYVAKANILPGMQVRKGQVLAVLQDPSFIQLQQDYLLAQSKLQYLQKEFTRQEALNRNKTTSDKMFEQTAAEYRAERISVGALKEKLRLLGINPVRLQAGNISRTVNLHAPISGYVSVVDVNRGKYVSPTDVLFEIVDPTGLHLSLTVFEKDLSLLKPGQAVKAWLTSDTTKPYTASVHYIGRTLDENRSAPVHCDFSGSTADLVPGTFLNAEITTNERQATVVPEDAVVRFGAGEYIFIGKGNNMFEMTPVQTGARAGGMVELGTQNPELLQQTIITKGAYAALMKLHNRSEEE